MEPVGFWANNGLAILLDNWSTYLPGDTVSGRVMRSQEFAERDVTLQLDLKGRAKATIRESREISNNYDYTLGFDENQDALDFYNDRHTHDCYDNQNVYNPRHTRAEHTTHSSCFEFFKPGDTTMVLHSGILHMPKGSDARSWPFSMRLPINANPAAVMRGNNPERSYLELNDIDIANSTLPDSFVKTVSKQSTTLFSHVEYYIEARMFVTVPRLTVIYTATAPIIVKSPVSYKLQGHEDFALRRTDSIASFRSYKLEHDAVERKLTFKEKRRSLFGSSKMPELNLQVQVACPSVLQINNAVPFNIRVFPNRDSAPSILQNTSLKYTLASLSLKLVSETDVACASDDVRGYRQTADYEYPFANGSVLPLDSNPIELPVGNEKEGLDIGSSLQLRFTELAAMRGANEIIMKWPQRLQPDFVTYNTRNKHRLKWKMTVQIQGTSFKQDIKGSQKVTILGPESSAVGKRLENRSQEAMQDRYRRLLLLDGVRVKGNDLIKKLVAA